MKQQDKARVVVPFNTGTRVHPDEKKYDKRQRQWDKQEMRRNDWRDASELLKIAKELLG